MTSRLDLDAIARALASRSNRRTVLKGSAAVAATGVAAMAVGVRPSDAAAQDAAKLSFWFDTTGGAETAQCLIDKRLFLGPQVLPGCVDHRVHVLLVSR